jgi:triacylglycerol lipase
LTSAGELIPVNIVLAHGVLGFRERFRVEYFNGVAEHLRKLPANVLVSEVSPSGSIAARGESLRTQIITGFNDGALDASEKAHIVAHSMGGLDSRYVLSPRNESTTSKNDITPRIASLTTISTPHRGSPIADLLAFRPVDESAKARAIKAVLDRLGNLEKTLTEWLDRLGVSLDALKDLTTEGTRAFNDRYPNHPGVRYFSVAGSGRNGLLPTAFVLLPCHRYIRAVNGEASDALVPVSSAQWGEFDANTWHCDDTEEVGHDLDHPFERTQFDYKARYDEIVKHASRP